MHPPPPLLLQLVDELLGVDPLLLGRLVTEADQEERLAATFNFNITDVEVDLTDQTATISDVLDAAAESPTVPLQDLLRLFEFASDLTPEVVAIMKREFGDGWKASVAWMFMLPERSDRFLVAALVACQGNFNELPGVIELGRTDWRDLLVSGGLANADWRSDLDRILSD